MDHAYLSLLVLEQAFVSIERKNIAYKLLN